MPRSWKLTASTTTPLPQPEMCTWAASIGIDASWTTWRKRLRSKHRIDPRENPAGLQRLFREAEDAKRTLSTREQTTITFEHGGDVVRVPITRQKFEEMTADLLDRTRFTVNNLLQEAGLKWDDLTRLLLVGGSTRMPMVQRMLEEISNKKPDRSLSADEAVAHGAAVYAGLILGSEAGMAPEVTVRNVNSHDLGVLGKERATGRPRNRVMISRNTPLPANHTARFVTAQANQPSVAVNVVEGGDASGNDATQIGKCIVRNLPAGLACRIARGSHLSVWSKRQTDGQGESSWFGAGSHVGDRAILGHDGGNAP